MDKLIRYLFLVGLAVNVIAFDAFQRSDELTTAAFLKIMSNVHAVQAKRVVPQYYRVTLVTNPPSVH